MLAVCQSWARSYPSPWRLPPLSERCRSPRRASRRPTVALMVSRRIAWPVSTSPASIVSIPSRSRLSANAAWLATRRCTPSLKLFVRAMFALRTSDEFETEFAADQGRGALKTLDRDVSLGLQDAIDLCAACVHALGESGLGD